MMGLSKLLELAFRLMHNLICLVDYQSSAFKAVPHVSWPAETRPVSCMVEKNRVVEMKASFPGASAARGNGSSPASTAMGFTTIKCFQIKQELTLLKANASWRKQALQENDIYAGKFIT